VVTSDWRTKYIWIQYILLLLCHLLASLLRPFICPKKLHCFVSRNDPWSLVRPLLGIQCCVFLFYMNTDNKDKGKLFLSSWWWHIQGGTALDQLFLMVALDGGEWSDFLMLQPLFHQRKNSWYPLNVRLGWPLNQSECFVEVKNLLNFQGIWPGFSSP